MTVLDAPLDTGPAWFDGTRPPSRAEEAWRHTPVGVIAHRLAEVEPAPVHAVTTALVEDLAGRHSPTQLVLVNGVLADRARDLVVPDGVHVSSGARGAVEIDVAAGLDLAEPIHVVHVSKPDGRWALARPRVIVSVAPLATMAVT